jgi:preprotein translocase subunit SecA/nephrocystin-3
MGKDINQLIKNRHIRLFISSTFEDMQDERNYLMRRTFPKLQLLAAQRDVMLTAIDLRWGITKEEAENGKVVDMCFQEIENSIPFFIGIIGNRYGWCPKPDDINSDTKLRFPQIKKLTGLSITEMEIQFAVLKRRRKINAYFYIKNNESDSKQIGEEEMDKEEKLSLLKETLQKSKRYKPQTYSNEEELARKVTDDFKSLLDKLFKGKSLSSLSKRLIRQKAFKNQLCHTYVKDEKNFVFLNDWLTHKEKRQLVVIGESGVGKSALLANWINELESKKNSNSIIVYHFVGNGGCEGNHEYIQNLISEEIISALGEKYKTSKTNYHREGALESAFTHVAERQDIRLLLIIDGVNQLAEDDAKSMTWVPIPPNNIKIVFSTVEKDKTMFFFKNRKYLIFQVLPLIDRQLKRDIVNKYLGNFAKKLSKSQVERIVSDSQCNNTLVLISLLNVLINFCTHDNLDETIEFFLHSDTVDDYYKALIQKYEKEFDKNKQTKGLVRYALSLIVVSRKGISENDIINITKVTPYYWSQFFCAFLRNFSISNSYITFSHQYVYNAVKVLYLVDTKWESQCRRSIIAYIKRRNNSQAWNEIPFQYYRLKDYKRLFAYLCNKNIFEYIYNNDKTSLIKYWRTMNQYEDYSIHNYIIGIEKESFMIDFKTIITLFDFCNIDLNLFQEAIYIAELAKKHAKSLEELHRCYMKLDIAYSKLGNYKLALDNSILSLHYARLIYSRWNIDLINPYQNLGIAYYELDDYENALYQLLNAARIIKRNYGEQSSELIELYDLISSIQRKMGTRFYDPGRDYDDMARDIEKRKELGLNSNYQFFDEYDIHIADEFHETAKFFSNQYKYKKAIPFYKKELRILRKVYGKNHERIADVHIAIAKEYDTIAFFDHDDISCMRHREMALNESLKAHKILKVIHGNYHPSIVDNLCFAAKLVDSPQKLSYYEQALEIALRIFEEKAKPVLKIYSLIADYYSVNGNFNQSVFYYDRIHSLIQDKNKKNDPFFDRVEIWRLIDINKLYVRNHIMELIKHLSNKPIAWEKVDILRMGKYFYNRSVTFSINPNNNDVYLKELSIEWEQPSIKKRKFELNIKHVFDEDRYGKMRRAEYGIKDTTTLCHGTLKQIYRYIANNDFTDHNFIDQIISELDRLIEYFFYGEK